MFDLYNSEVVQNALDEQTLQRCEYYQSLKTVPLNDHEILIEPHQGKSIEGNTFYLLQELAKNRLYADYKLYLVLAETPQKRAHTLLKFHGMTNVQIVTFLSDEHYALLARAKFLITDDVFQPFYTKKEGQVILYTGNATPLKAVGLQHKTDYHDVNDMQLALLATDFALFPNDYTKTLLTQDFMVEDLMTAHALMGNYPRNAALTDSALREDIRAKEDLSDKQVIAYMPARRRGVDKETRAKNRQILLQTLAELDEKLTDDQVLFTHIHPFIKNTIDYKQFKHIRRFPGKYETYEFLSTADVVVTDYSNVIFDVADTGRDVVLFTYDKEDFLVARDLNLDYDQLPFKQVADTEGLLQAFECAALAGAKTASTDSALATFAQTYAPYKGQSTAAALCARVILGDTTQADGSGKSVLMEQSIPHSGKENVLIYSGDLAKNGMTAALTALLNTIDVDKRNYYLTFYSSALGENKRVLKTLPKQVKYIPVSGAMNMTKEQKAVATLFQERAYPEPIIGPLFVNTCKAAYRDEFSRNYPQCIFTHVIHFTGYNVGRIMTLSAAPCKRTIFIHNTTPLEIKDKGNQRKAVVKYAYKTYDHVALVTEAMVKANAPLIADKKRVRVVHNFMPDKKILEKSKQPITLDPQTELRIPEEEFRKVLASSAKKFITIGRFSQEKGHTRLVDAFNRVWKENPDTYLIIIGGHGEKYEPLCEYIKDQECADHVIVVKSLINPYPVLKACDYFVLSSFYEAAPIVLQEANILGLPVISTDIPGPGDFIRRIGEEGIVPNSTDGVYQGMIDMLEGRITYVPLDFDSFNAQSLAEFEALLQ